MFDLRITSVLSSAVLVLMTWTYSKFFFFDYFYSEAPGLIVAQIAALVSWFVLILVPPVAVSIGGLPVRASAWLLIVSGGLRFVAQLWVHVVLLNLTGNFYADYLVAYPLFLFSDLLLPILYVIVGFRKLRS